MKYLILVSLFFVTTGLIAQDKTNKKDSIVAPPVTAVVVFDTLPPIPLTQVEIEDIANSQAAQARFKESAENELNSMEREFKGMVHGFIRGHNVRRYDNWVIRNNKLYILVKRQKK